MPKSKSHPCKHPRTAVAQIAIEQLDPDTSIGTFDCKKCGARFTEQETPNVSV